METKIVYFDESGDDGCNTASSDFFILSSIYMYTDDWQDNFNLMKGLKNDLKRNYDFPVKTEMHTKYFITDKLPYRNYGWTRDQRREILLAYIKTISELKIKCINVIIDKTKIESSDYPVLDTALTYNIQRIDDTSEHQTQWRYIIITDKGRVEKMRKTARLMRVYNPIRNSFDYDSRNMPIKYMIEDILEKDSESSFFIQIADFISYFVNLFYSTQYKRKELPNRVKSLLSEDEIAKTIKYFKNANILNIAASKSNKYGLVIYPK